MIPLAQLAIAYFIGKQSGSAGGGLPGFPGNGWTMWKTLPPDITTRAAALSQVIVPGGYYVETTNGRWTLYARLAQGLGAYRLTAAKVAPGDQAYA